jgi:hypothetical protein
MFASSRAEVAAFFARWKRASNMALANTAIRNAKPRDRDYKLTDSRGLYLLMTAANCGVSNIGLMASSGNYPSLDMRQSL